MSASAQGIPPVALAGTYDFSADAEQALVAGGAWSAALLPASVAGYDAGLPAEITIEPGAASGTITAVEARTAGGWRLAAGSGNQPPTSPIQVAR